MSYKTYTTRAIVCGSSPSNTADKSFLIFTQDMGALWATARSVREERSKQRFALQEFSLVKVSLVRGKSGWRIGSAESQQNFFTAADHQASRIAITKIIRLLRQFVRGEVAHPEVFADAESGLMVAMVLPPGELEKIIDLFSLRLLFHLGYLPRHEEYASLLEGSEWWKGEGLSAKTKAVIEKAKEASHL